MKSAFAKLFCCLLSAILWRFNEPFCTDDYTKHAGIRVFSNLYFAAKEQNLWLCSYKEQCGSEKIRKPGMFCVVNIPIHVSALRSSHPEVFCKKGVLINFTKFTRKHLCQGLFYNKVAGLSPATLSKKRLWHRCFPVIFVKFLRIPFLTEHLCWLLLCFPAFYNKSSRILESIAEVHLELNQKSKAERFCENSYQLLAVDARMKHRRCSNGY